MTQKAKPQRLEPVEASVKNDPHQEKAFAMDHITASVKPTNVIFLPTAALAPVVNPRVPGRRPRVVIHIREARARRADAAHWQRKVAADLELREERLRALGSLRMRRAMLEEEIQHLQLVTGVR